METEPEIERQKSRKRLRDLEHTYPYMRIYTRTHVCACEVWMTSQLRRTVPAGSEFQQCTECQPATANRRQTSCCSGNRTFRILPAEIGHGAKPEEEQNPQAQRFLSPGGHDHGQLLCHCPPGSRTPLSPLGISSAISTLLMQRFCSDRETHQRIVRTPYLATD